MQLKTILNQCYKFKSFVYGQVRFVNRNGKRHLEVEMIPRRNSKAICSCCECPAPLYDRLKTRRFEFIPLWGYRVFLVYLMRRVDCIACGVKVEQVPWARGKQELTATYQQFLAHWAKKLSWKEVAVSFRTSWEKVFQAVGCGIYSGMGAGAPGSFRRYRHWCGRNCLAQGAQLFDHGLPDLALGKLPTPPMTHRFC
jgi:transposase